MSAGQLPRRWGEPGDSPTLVLLEQDIVRGWYACLDCALADHKPVFGCLMDLRRSAVDPSNEMPRASGLHLPACFPPLMLSCNAPGLQLRVRTKIKDGVEGSLTLWRGHCDVY